MEIKLPFLKQPIGAGDIVKAATSAAGIQPCPPWQKRREAMNRALTLTPRVAWTKPPHVPEGWTLHREHEAESKSMRMFVNQTTGGAIIWDVIEGQYRNSKSFCCATLRAKAEARWDELCR